MRQRIVDSVLDVCLTGGENGFFSGESPLIKQVHWLEACWAVADEMGLLGRFLTQLRALPGYDSADGAGAEFRSRVDAFLGAEREIRGEQASVRAELTDRLGAMGIPIVWLDDGELAVQKSDYFGSLELLGRIGFRRRSALQGPGMGLQLGRLSATNENEEVTLRVWGMDPEWVERARGGEPALQDRLTWLLSALSVSEARPTIYAAAIRLLDLVTKESMNWDEALHCARVRRYSGRLLALVELAGHSAGRPVMPESAFESLRAGLSLREYGEFRRLIQVRQSVARAFFGREKRVPLPLLGRKLSDWI